MHHGRPRFFQEDSGRTILMWRENFLPFSLISSANRVLAPFLEGERPAWCPKSSLSAPPGFGLTDPLAQLLEARGQDARDVHLAHPDGRRDLRLGKTLD